MAFHQDRVGSSTMRIARRWSAGAVQLTRLPRCHALARAIVRGAELSLAGRSPTDWRL